MELRYSLNRGHDGLGIDVNGLNVIVRLHGQAEAGGLAQLGDKVLSVDFIELSGRRLAAVMLPEHPKYELCIWREAAEFQAQVTWAFGPLHGPLHLLEVEVQKGNEGLGVDMGPHSRIAEIVPGGQAETDAMLRVGDVVVAVDRIWVSARGPHPHPLGPSHHPWT